MVDMLKATQQGQHRYGVDADWGLLDSGAHWRHRANTVESSVCSGDAALSQITLITCYDTGYKGCLDSACSSATFVSVTF